MLGLIRSGNRCPATRASPSQRLISATPRLHIPATATKPNRQLPIHSPADPILLVTPAQIPLHAAQPASRPITTRRADRQRKPVVVDGFISTAAALIAQAIEPRSAEFMIASHRSQEQGHQQALGRLGKQPLIDLNFRLGEGTGAAMVMPMLDAAARLLTDVATFAEAAVSTADR